MHEDLIRVIGLMQDSRMAVYVHEGPDGNGIRLREMVTDRVCKAICPSGYEGRAGELWYARILPPPIAEFEEHIVFTTPYVLVEPGEREWLVYFDRTLPEEPPERRIAAYEKHMVANSTPSAHGSLMRAHAGTGPTRVRGTSKQPSGRRDEPPWGSSRTTGHRGPGWVDRTRHDASFLPHDLPVPRRAGGL